MKRLRGWWRLRHGYCPLCYSSPPPPDCPVCRGSREYGPLIGAKQRNILTARWHKHLEEST